MAHFRGAAFVSNDGHARSAAQELGIGVSGGLGLLQAAVDAGTISSLRAVQIREEMFRNGAWFSDELMQVFRASVLK